MTMDHHVHRWSLRPPRAPEPGITSRDFAIATTRGAEVDVVLVTGVVDAFTGRRMTRRVRDLVLTGSPGVVLDLSAVTFLDAGGVGAIAATRRLLAARGTELSLVCPEGPALRLLGLLGLDVAWQVRPAPQRAKASRHSRCETSSPSS
jgi:anti-sigma B factor antagonist